MLFGAGQKIDKLMRGRPQIADAPIRRQRAHMQQDSGGTLKFHIDIIIDALAGAAAAGAFEKLWRSVSRIVLCFHCTEEEGFLR